ncbi:small hydrophilic protein [Streptomyces sp. NPDC000880]
MAFSHRMATLAAVVAIPLGVAATSYALTDSPKPPTVPREVQLDSTPSRTTTPGASRSPTAPGPPPPTPSATGTAPIDSVVPGPSATGDDDDDDIGDEG